jgi:hypothetical protein
VFLGVLVSFVPGDLRRQLFRDDVPNLVSVLPIDVPELLVEGPDDVA